MDSRNPIYNITRVLADHDWNKKEKIALLLFTQIIQIGLARAPCHFLHFSNDQAIPPVQGHGTTT